MAAFTSPEDIANRGLQHCGSKRIVSLADTSRQAGEVNACYNKLRRAELRRNAWRFSVRRTALRPYTYTTQFITFPTWSAGAFGAGRVVTYPAAGTIWETRVSTSTTPSNAAASDWLNYFGPRTADVYQSDIEYFAGELVIVPAAYAGGTTYAINSIVTDGGITYISLASGNIGHTPASSATYWAAWTTSTTFLGAPVYPTGYAIYRSRVNANEDAVTTGSWVAQTSATVVDQPFFYPVSAGPVSQTNTQNVYIFPNGYLREAPQDPKNGGMHYLGAGTRGRQYTDWVEEAEFFITRDNTPIVYRFAADVEQVRLMDDLFCEGFGCRIGLEVCEPLTQSTEKLSVISKLYNTFMSEARAVNAIESGTVEAAVDDYLACRI